MKKNLAKRIVLGLLTGAVLMSSSVAWADNIDYGYKIELNSNLNLASTSVPDDSLSIGGYIAERQTNDNGTLRSQGSIKSVAIGVSSEVGLKGHALSDNVALGYDATVGTCSGGTAIGSMTIANATNSTALGFSAVADGLGSVALGSGSNVEIDEQYVVSVGAGGESGGFKNIGTEQNLNNVPNTRSIINVTDVATAADLGDDEKIMDVALGTYGSYVVNMNTLKKALDEVQATNDTTYVKIEGYGTPDEKVVISEGEDAQVTFEDDKVIFGTNSSWYEANQGFFAGGNTNHDVSSAQAALKEDGSLMGAGGKFEVYTDGSVKAANGAFAVDATGNVTASSYIIKDSNGNETNIKTALD